MVFKKITDPYTRWESGLYDWLIAPRITAALETILQETDFSFLLSAEEPLNVLDVGCGGGQNALFLKKRSPSLELTGLDLSADQIRRAQARDPQGTVNFLVGDALDLPFPDRSFDAVFSLGSMKHWPDMEKGLKECLRVLSPQGRLMIMDSLSDAAESDIRAFFHLLKLPFFAYPMFRLFFARIVIRQSPSLERLQKICPPPLRLKRITNFPGFVLSR